MTQALPVADELREELACSLVERGSIRSPEVARAFRTVPRHRFIPDVGVGAAYADEAVVTKRSVEGVSLSSVSAPWLQAEMLEQARLVPGARVLEIGSGGYNAALAAELVGESGQVVSVDIDTFATGRARRFLRETGYGDRVQVVEGDGAYGVPDYVPASGFDAIIVTAQAVDVPVAWRQQLAGDGRLVVPLRVRGISRGVCFVPEGGHLRSVEVTQCGFVPMRGAAAVNVETAHLDRDEVLLVADEGVGLPGEALACAFGQERVEVWPGVPLARGEDVLAHLDLWLATVVAPYGRFHASRDAVERGTVRDVVGVGMSATWSGSSLAYVALRRTGEPEGARDALEVGVCGHGPDGEELARGLAEEVRGWHDHHRPGPRPVFRAYPAGTPGGMLHGGHVVDKASTRVVISWEG